MRFVSRISLHLFVFFVSLCWMTGGAHAKEFSSSNEEIRGVALVGGKKALFSNQELRSMQGLWTRDLDLPGSLYALQEELEPFYLNQAWTQETLQALKQKVYQYYISQDQPFVIISIPPQHKSSRIVQLIVEESRLGKVEVVGNEWVPSQRFLNYFHTRAGEPISLKRIGRDVDFMNRSPFRRVDLIYSPGVAENTTDLTLAVHDRRPYRFYAGTDNTGVPSTGRMRIFAGFSWDQLFNLDHTFFYQYTTNTHVNRFHANTFQYLALLPCEHILNLYGGFSVLQADIPAPNRHNEGTNIQGSIRYLIPFFFNRTLSHELTAGFDLKNTNNTMEFTDVAAVFGQTVNMSQFMLGYQLKLEYPSSSVQTGFDLFFSPFDWLPNQSQAAFNSLRPGAKNKWIYATGFVNFRQALGSYSYRLFARAQVTPQALLPSEQLGLGGYDTVRGYDERQYNADIGILTSAEFYFPSFSIFRSRDPHRDKMYFLLFLDAGGGCDNQKVPEIKWADYLMGIGPGVRYSFSSYLNARLDWGLKLHHQEGFTGGGSMFHFSVTGSY